ncbi:MAG TPA: peptidyl-prolyl cis-trans isomerase [Candidatus Polarisedimenticolaceae bacterium]|nr:peptidyl-prolyl cis-trans isomerase [Candidatus Polarisedimenticolaceae bacterium]
MSALAAARRIASFLFLLGAVLPARAEVLEEIVAKVNDEIITKTDLEAEDQAMTAELYRSLSGPELDRRLSEGKAMLLRRMIDRRLLMQRGERMFTELDKMGDSLVDRFVEYQNIKDKAELSRLLAQEGLTLAEFKRRLLEQQVPDEVLRYEVGGRVAVGDKEVETYYRDHPQEFTVPAEATVREIVLLAEGADVAQRRAEAEAVRARAAAGEDFGALAKEFSQAGTKENGGLLGTIHKGDIAPELEAAAFSVPVGSVSTVIEMSHGFHVLKIDARTEERLKPLEEVREATREKIADHRYGNDLQAFLDKSWNEATIWINPKYADRLDRWNGKPRAS